MGVKLYGNCHSCAIRLRDILLLVKYMTEEFLFNEKLSRIRMQDNGRELAFLTYLQKTLHASLLV